jgi:hypothetical protein
MGANDTQIGGDHYKTGGVEHWDWAADMPYLEARCTAYIARHQDKKGIEDIKKSLHFIQKILERRYNVSLVWRIVDLEEDGPQPPREYVNPDL